MNIRVTVPVLLVAAPVLWAQKTVDLHFVHIESIQEIQEVATLIRGIGDIRNISLDERQRVFTVQGTPEQVALAGWLFKELDQPATSHKSDMEFTVPVGNADVVGLFYAPYTETVQDFQEVAVGVRSATDIGRLFTENARRAVAARGTADQIALARWLFTQFGDPSTAKSGSPVYRIPTTEGSPLETENTVRVFHIPNTNTVMEFQEAATTLRTISNTRRLFTYNSKREFVARGTSEQIELIGWLLGHFDHSAPEDSPAEFQITAKSPTGDNIVRVFHLPQTMTVQQVQQAAVLVRSSTGIRTAFGLANVHVLAVRGTASQVGEAAYLVSKPALKQ